MKKEIVNKILKETETGYDLISEKFSQTRNRFWGGLEFIGKYSEKNGKVLDFGCGNGRLLGILENRNISYVGVDVSEKLIDIAKNNYQDRGGFRDVQFIKIDNNLERLAFSDNFFDASYSIAVFHHLPSLDLRVEIARELYRVTKKGGYVVATVWDLWQTRYRKRIFNNWTNKIKGRSELDWNDAWVTFTDNEGKVFKRYHHAFTKRDLRRTFEKAGFEVEKVTRVDGNIVLVGRRLIS